jgi:hypothetical protein
VPLALHLSLLLICTVCAHVYAYMVYVHIHRCTYCLW